MKPDELAQVHAAAFTDQRAWSASEFADFLGTAGVILCGDVRSFILGRVTLDEAEILTLATDPANRRQGLARAALRDFETQAATTGATRVFLEVAEDNTAAKHLYSNMNYHIIGTRPNYYARPNGTKVAATIMQKLIA